MKPTHPAGKPQLLTGADSARIRDLREEQAGIIARLRELEGREIASLLQPQIQEIQIWPMTRR